MSEYSYEETEVFECSGPAPHLISAYESIADPIYEEFAVNGSLHVEPRIRVKPI